jgi:lysozyme
MKISNEGIKTLMKLEGFSPVPYADGKGFSIGYGHFIRKGENLTRITKAEAYQLLVQDLPIYENNILKAIKKPLSQSQFDALVIWNYNTGRTQSDLYNLINTGASLDAIKNFWINTYITSNGQKLQALVRRRLLEWNLFASGPAPLKKTLLPIGILILLLLKAYNNSHKTLLFLF